MNKLREIFRHKEEEVDRVRAAIPLRELKRAIADAPPVRPFRAALSASAKPVALIAEVKKASPSRGVIREDFDPAAIAEVYRDAGADCLSVLTESRYFQGSRENLEQARAASGLPCLRKDFIFEPYQVYEARVWGADCILLIAAGFADLAVPVLRDLGALARELGMDALVEVHSEAEAEDALESGADLIGVNNRDLADMSISLEVSERLLPLISPHALTVSESGMAGRVDLERVRAAGARAALIGTTFIAAPDIGAKVREVMG